jgi:hypothetical protein
MPDLLAYLDDFIPLSVELSTRVKILSSPRVALALSPSSSNLLCTAHAFHYVRPQHHDLSTFRLPLALLLSLCTVLYLSSAPLRNHLRIFASLTGRFASIVRKVTHHGEDDNNEEDNTANETCNEDRNNETWGRRVALLVVRHCCLWVHSICGRRDWTGDNCVILCLV